ncbi:DUF7159 family protein [Mycobacterium servetii]|uniref:DUF7159 domain-containing protein n=1 Tax=Mycobacterium servetii TaxID=3237418 RepID=A0ABV4C8S1_9MYCO
MDVVVGMSVAPAAVRLVLVEGAGAGGVTVDRHDFGLAGKPPTAAADVAIEAILRTRDAAAAGGYRLRSTGITCTDDAEAAALRDALARRRIDDVTLVSAFTAAAALAQALGRASKRDRTALLFVEPAAATLVVVDTAAGPGGGVRRRALTKGDAATAQLAAMVSGVAAQQDRPGEVFLVGAGVDIRSIKAALEAATPLPMTAPEEPELALARGAALAAATAQVGEPPTLAMPPAQDLAAPARGRVENAETEGETNRGRRRRRSVLLAGAAMAVLVAGVAAVALVLVLNTGSHGPATQAPPPKTAAPAPPPPSATPAPPPPARAAPSPAPVPAAPPPAPAAPPPQQGPPARPGGDDHGGGAWLRRHLDRYGIPVPWP